jgi:hypothetical protein
VPVLVWAAVSTIVAPASAQLRIARVGQAPVNVPRSEHAQQLSGLAWAGGERFFAVSDTTGALVELSIALDRATGAVQQVALVGSVRLPNAFDLEDLVWMGARGSVLVLDESPPLLREHGLDGSLRAELALPARLVDRVRSDFGPEAVAMSPRGQAFYVASEDALEGDGERAGIGRTSLVRVFRLDAAFSPAGEWAYRLDGLEMGCAITPQCRSGLVAMIALGNRKLLVLERALTGVTPLGVPLFRSRIYAVQLEAESEVSRVEHLGTSVTPVPKQLLFDELVGPVHNYEGMALGPTLDDGSRALLLISDDGPYLLQSVLALRVYDLPAPPAAAPCELAPVHFGPDSDELAPDALAAVRRNAACIVERGAQRVTILGHTDARGAIDYNLALAARRAEAVRTALLAAGLSPELFEVVPLGPDAVRGELDPDQLAEQHERARRVELRLE